MTEASLRRRVRRPERAAFTLIELLVVVVVVAILIAITLTAGLGVLQSQRTRLAEDSIRVLDGAVDSYTRTVSAAPPPLVEVPNPDPGLANDPTQNVLLPFADAADFTANPAEDQRVTINTSGLFVRLLDTAGLGDVVRPLEGEALSFFDPDDGGNAGGTLGNRQPELRSILDPWGNPIRFVHPRFDGIIRQSPPNAPGDRGNAVDLSSGQIGDLIALEDLPSGYVLGDVVIDRIRRNRLTDADREQLKAAGTPAGGLVGDSDGGICPGGRPYAYSAGADGDPSTLTDNAYTTEPTPGVD